MPFKNYFRNDEEPLGSTRMTFYNGLILGAMLRDVSILTSYLVISFNFMLFAVCIVPDISLPGSR
jgi:hypothetical protein